MKDIQIGCICLVDQTVMRSLPGAQRLLHECGQAQCPLAFTQFGATGFYLGIILEEDEGWARCSKI